QRGRASVLVEQDDASLLIDTSPDLRTQLLRENVQKLNAVIFTHAHADHAHGIDDLRAMNWHMKAPIPIYADQTCMDELKHRFGYIFETRGPAENYFKPALEPHIISGPLDIGPFNIIPFEQRHGRWQTLGFRIGNFAYSTDCNDFPENSLAALQNL